MSETRFDYMYSRICKIHHIIEGKTCLEKTYFQHGHRYIKTDSKSQNETKIVLKDKYSHQYTQTAITLFLKNTVLAAVKMSLITHTLSTSCLMEGTIHECTLALAL